MSEIGKHDRLWRCQCGGGHFLSVSWDAGDEHEDGTAEVHGQIAIEGDFWPVFRARIAAAWRVLRYGHSTHGVAVELDPATAREIAAVLAGFSDAADPLRDHGPVPPPPGIRGSHGN